MLQGKTLSSGEHDPRGAQSYGGIDMNEATKERFWSKIDVGGTGCWEWNACTRHQGYGAFHTGSRKHGTEKMNQAHRMAWELTFGKIPDGLLVCHRCDNKKCCNPFHLFVGTHSDNLKDAYDKGKKIFIPDNSGENSGLSKLTWKQVREIRKLKQMHPYLSQRLIGKLYKVRQGTIWHILNDKTWKDINK